jgi:2-keto-3-deoxy-L-fuconate dehydrogenase
MQYTTNLALRAAADGIRVNAVAPATIETPLFDPYAAAGVNVKSLLDVQAKLHAVGRIGQPEEVAELICFLSSNAAAGFMTGDIILIDGGASLVTKLGSLGMDRKRAAAAKSKL